MQSSKSPAVQSWFLLFIGLLFSQLLLAQTDSPDFSIVVIPDPQNYSASHPQVFASQTKWIVDNISTLNILMVVGEGDMVYHDASATEWATAETAVDVLDGKVPYAFAIGNHDYDNYKPSARGATHFNDHFGPSRYASYSWYGGNYNNSNENFYTFFTAGTDKYMVLALEFYPRTSVITWAHSLLNTYSDRKVIVVTHSFEGTDGMRVDLCDTQDMSASSGTNPQLLWTNLLRQHPNVMLVLSGHLIGNGTARRSDLGQQGNLVHQIFTNFQDWPSGKEGYLRILKFHPSQNTIDVVTYSPWINTYQTSSAYQFTLAMRATPSTQTTGGLEGKVRSSDCIKIPGANVSTAGSTATTDRNGVYRLSALSAPNGYGLSVAAPYYGGNTSNQDVFAGFNTQSNFFLDTTVKASCSLSSTVPSVTICSPAANTTVVSPVRVNAGTRSSRTLAYMQVYIDGINRGTFYTSAVDQSYTLTAGSHRLTVQAKDIGGVFTKQTVYLTVSVSTSVSITSPVNNAIVTSPIPVRATAQAGSGTTIEAMNIYLDGVKVYSTAGASISTSVIATSGSRRLTVQARDSAGTYVKSTIYVTVK